MYFRPSEDGPATDCGRAGTSLDAPHSPIKRSQSAARSRPKPTSVSSSPSPYSRPNSAASFSSSRAGSAKGSKKSLGRSKSASMARTKSNAKLVTSYRYDEPPKFDESAKRLSGYAPSPHGRQLPTRRGTATKQTQGFTKTQRMRDKTQQGNEDAFGGQSYSSVGRMTMSVQLSSPAAAFGRSTRYDGGAAVGGDDTPGPTFQYSSTDGQQYESGKRTQVDSLSASRCGTGARSRSRRRHCHTSSWARLSFSAMRCQC